MTISSQAMRNTAHLGQVGVDDAGGQRNERLARPWISTSPRSRALALAAAGALPAAFAAVGRRYAGSTLKSAFPPIALCVNLVGRASEPRS